MNMTNEDVGGEWDSGNYQILPEGYYKASVKSAEAKVSTNGNDMVNLVLTVEHDEFNGVTVYNNLMFMPDNPDSFVNSKRKWFQVSAGLPYSLEDNKDNIAKLIVGRKLTIKVKTKIRDDGKEQNEIVGVHHYNWKPKTSDDTPPPVTDDDLGDAFL